MRKEKLGNYLIDVSKYFLTGVFVASLIKDLENVRWLIYALSGTIALVLLLLGLILKIKERTQNDRYINNFRNGWHSVNNGIIMVSYPKRQEMATPKQYDLN